ncbi:ribosome maturation factor RimM [Edaphobacter bradus]|uniref:ribosome maturation factor RimM n=1 Tax=Edaphobacter bradus TaxID=2259016 RepID=UPI0021E098E6|nr:ribosome maturation factor RimM [Edaphobacter bradus]
MLNDLPSWIVLAHLLRPQGRKGELLADLLTDFPERFSQRASVFLAPQGFKGSRSEAREVEVISSWLPVGRNQGRVVLHFAGIDSITDAESVAGLDVIVPLEERLPLDEESVYISDLVGCVVYNGSSPVGLIEEVQFPATPDGSRRLDEAAPLLVVRAEKGDEVLIPFAKAFLRNVDTKAKRIEMMLPAGLLEVNRPAEES